MKGIVIDVHITGQSRPVVNSTGERAIFSSIILSFARNEEFCPELFETLCTIFSNCAKSAVVILVLAGNRNTSGSFNNRGSNANFWSSSENSSSNAWRRNLNSSNATVNRNNNTKANGFSVRCVSTDQKRKPSCEKSGRFFNKKMTHENLLKDLFHAYYSARKNKRSTINALKFEMEYEKNIFQLCRDIESRKYEIGKSVAFIVNKPVKREIFAADFRDRVVHHLIFNYINPIFESHFIKDSYSCRIGKGTSYGIKRADHFIRSCSENYQKDCWILKLDISGYFMSIDKNILYGKIERKLIDIMSTELNSESELSSVGLDFASKLKGNLVIQANSSFCHSHATKGSAYGKNANPGSHFSSQNLDPQSAVGDDKKQGCLFSKNFGFDGELLLYLIRKTVFHDPTKNCVVKGKRKDWVGLPKSKSLFFAKKDKGLPIGNLTSQLFGNIYLDEFDHFVKEKLGVKHYGRYVDDMVFAHRDKEFLKSIIGKIKRYLQSNLGLELHPKKIYLQHFTKGVQFLGMFIKPYRIYVSRRIRGNFQAKIRMWSNLAEDGNLRLETRERNLEDFISCANSYLGIMKHYKTFRLRKKIVDEILLENLGKYVDVCEKYEKVRCNRYSIPNCN